MSPLTPAAAQSVRYRFGDFSIDSHAPELLYAGRVIALEAKPREVLLHLLKHRDETVSKDELFEACWPGRIVTESTLAKAVMKLRIALRDDAQTLVKTVHGIGYRWIAPVALDVVHARAPLAIESLTLKRGDALPLRPNFTLAQVLGRGGFGEVWLARQAKSDACAVFKFAFDGVALAALKREVTLSRLLRESAHSNAHVLPNDWNFDELPYFVEYAYYERGNLLEWAQNNGALLAIALPERIEIAARLADALAAAHSLGVLHKDMKPSNVLMRWDENIGWQPCLSDFGSGRALNPERLSALGITALGLTKTSAASDSPGGTPLYLAPELIRGESSSIKADIYALAVISYQLIVGDFRKHLAPGWEREIADPLLTADIAAAADTEPARRLGDAAALAQLFRTLEPRRLARQQADAAALQAERDRVSLGLSQKRRRTWQLVAMASSLAIAVVGVLAWRLSVERNEARASAERAEAISAFLGEDLLAQGDPVYGLGADTRLLDVLNSAGAKIAERFADRAEIAVPLYRNLGDSLLALDRGAEANALFQTALGVLPQLPADARRSEGYRLYLSLGDAAIRAAKFPAARKYFQQALALVGNSPSDSRYGWLAAELAWLDFEEGRLVEAQARLRALVIAVTAVGKPEQSREVLQFSRHYHALTLVELSRFAEAEKIFQTLEAELMARNAIDHVALAQLQRNYAALLRERGDLPAAKAKAEPALARVMRRLPPQHVEVLALRSEVALIRAMGNEPGALAELRATAKIREATMGLAHNRVRQVWLRIAELNLQAQDSVAALEILQRVCPATVAQFGPAHPQTLWCYSKQLEAWRQLGQFTEARELATQMADAVEALPDGFVRKAMIALRVESALRAA